MIWSTHVGVTVATFHHFAHVCRRKMCDLPGCPPIPTPTDPETKTIEGACRKIWRKICIIASYLSLIMWPVMSQISESVNKDVLVFEIPTTGQLSSQCLFFGEGPGHWKILCAIIFCLTYTCSPARFFLMLGDIAGIHQGFWKVLMAMNVRWLDKYLWWSLQVNDVSSFHSHQAAEERARVEVVAHW